MAIIIEQQFPLGRFHATRWKQGSFADPYGEWPPSPYRLLRALANRWFQYAREQGWQSPQEESYRKNELYPLLETLANQLPRFFLPVEATRLLAYKQYQPIGIEWSDPAKGKPAYKRRGTTLVSDQCWSLPPESVIIWFWEVEIENQQRELLDALLSRIVYFGRAESFCRMRLLNISPADKKPNCSLGEISTRDSVPVLAPIPGQFSVETLLLATGDRKLADAPLPEGTRWFYARLPQTRKSSPIPARRATYPSELQSIQFAVGGRVFPPLHKWVRVTEQFRGRVIKQLAIRIEPSSQGKYARLSAEAREQISLMTGKNSNGKPLSGHQHAYFLLWPDAEGVPNRLVVFRREPFRFEEIVALLSASEKPIRWDFAAPQWSLRIAPLPFDVPPPHGLFESSHVWRSATPFVPPANRHRFRKDGRERHNESLSHTIARLLRAQNFPQPASVEGLTQVTWVYLHETRERRKMRLATGTPWVRPAYALTLRFEQNVPGPIILGDSAHFGLGLFVPAQSDY